MVFQGFLLAVWFAFRSKYFQEESSLAFITNMVDKALPIIPSSLHAVIKVQRLSAIIGEILVKFISQQGFEPRSPWFSVSTLRTELSNQN